MRWLPNARRSGSNGRERRDEVSWAAAVHSPMLSHFTLLRFYFFRFYTFQILLFGKINKAVVHSPLLSHFTLFRFYFSEKSKKECFSDFTILGFYCFVKSKQQWCIVDCFSDFTLLTVFGKNPKSTCAIHCFFSSDFTPHYFSHLCERVGDCVSPTKYLLVYQYQYQYWTSTTGSRWCLEMGERKNGKCDPFHVIVIQCTLYAMQCIASTEWRSLRQRWKKSAQSSLFSSCCCSATLQMLQKHECSKISQEWWKVLC